MSCETFVSRVEISCCRISSFTYKQFTVSGAFISKNQIEGSGRKPSGSESRTSKLYADATYKAKRERDVGELNSAVQLS